MYIQHLPKVSTMIKSPITGHARAVQQAGASSSARTCPQLKSTCIAVGLRSLKLNFGKIHRDEGYG